MPKDVQVSQSSSTSHVHTSQDSKIVAQVKGQGQQEEITQIIIGAGEEDEEEELVQARVNLTDWDPVSILKKQKTSEPTKFENGKPSFIECS